MWILYDPTVALVGIQFRETIAHTQEKHPEKMFTESLVED